MQMNLQLHHVVQDVTGATGMKIIRSIVAGELPVTCSIHAAILSQSGRCLTRWRPRVPTDLIVSSLVVRWAAEEHSILRGKSGLSGFENQV